MTEAERVAFAERRDAIFDRYQVIGNYAAVAREFGISPGRLSSIIQSESMWRRKTGDTNASSRLHNAISRVQDNLQKRMNHRHMKRLNQVRKAVDFHRKKLLAAEIRLAQLETLK